MRAHLLFTGLGAGNTGDEAMLEGFLSLFPILQGSTVEVFNAESSIVQTLPRQLVYLDWKDRKTCRDAALEADRVLMVGGTPVVEDWGLDWPMRFHALELQFLRDRGRRADAIGLGIDHLRSSEARALFKKGHGNIESWIVRSERCRRALLALEVPEASIHVASDLAWLFMPGNGERDWAQSFWRELGIDPSRPLIGVNVVNERWQGATKVKETVAKVLDELIREYEFQVAFLCNESREGAYFDIAAARETAGLMLEKPVIVPNHYFTPSQMVALLSHCDLTVSQRYHFTVLSVVAGALPLSFARGPQMEGLINDLRQRPVGAMESCNPELLRESAVSAFSDRVNNGMRQVAAKTHLRIRSLESSYFWEESGWRHREAVGLASVKELESPEFRLFMGAMNDLASAWGLRQFTNWSKVWEYPWLWMSGLRSVDWSGTKLLDLGSELSPMPWYLASLGAEVTLVEVDEQWVSSWEKLRRATGYNVQWRIVSEEELPFRDGTFEVVTSYSVIEHQVDKRGAMDEVVRVLKPGGLLGISFDICESEMGMTFPEWNGSALTMKEFEELIWDHPALEHPPGRPRWNTRDIDSFIKWNLLAAEHHNYTVGAAILRRSRPSGLSQ